jgi:hypothetical protein
MKTITLKLYRFNELDKPGKEKALTTYRGMNVDFDWWDDEFEDFIELCSYMGIAVIKDSIKFRGFYGQGDGSGFSAKADLLKLQDAIKTQAWKTFAPLQEFPFNPANIDRRIWPLIANGILPNDPQIICAQRHYGVVVDLGMYVVNEGDKLHDNVFEELDLLEEWLRKIAVTLNKYLYASLEKQYEFLISDTAIKESILSNDYLFTADGRSANYLEQLTKRKN